MITNWLWDKARAVGERFDKERQNRVDNLISEDEWESSCEELCEEFYSIINQMYQEDHPAYNNPIKIWVDDVRSAPFGYV